jgi:sortase (surface protein transpeptidase)
LCGCDPKYSQTDETDFVRSLLTSDVRAIGNVAKFQNNERIEQYAIDVDATPIPGNAAHAEIYAHPQISSRGVFRRLQESLVHLSRWEEGFGP